MTEENIWTAILWTVILAWSTTMMIIKIIFKPITPSNRPTRVYEDDTWVIDLIDGKVRVSYFEDGHFVDEIILTGNDFYGRR